MSLEKRFLMGIVLLSMSLLGFLCLTLWLDPR